MFFCGHMGIEAKATLVMPVVDAGNQVIAVMMAANKSRMQRFTDED